MYKQHNIYLTTKSTVTKLFDYQFFFRQRLFTFQSVLWWWLAPSVGEIDKLSFMVPALHGPG